MNKFAYSALVAFISSLVTLSLVVWLAPSTTVASSAGELRVIEPEELARHDTADSCWKAIGGRVYDVTEFIDRHPTPEAVMTEWCGRDSTEAWNDLGNGRSHSASAERLLANFLIGRLAGAALEEADEPDVMPEKTSPAPVGGYRDGSYYAESEPDDRGYIGIIEVTVNQGRILGVYYDEITRDEAGNVSSRKSADLNYAQRWRRVSGGVSQLSAYPAYQVQLLKSAAPDGVDALSGATGTYESFVGLAEEALRQAR